MGFVINTTCKKTTITKKYLKNIYASNSILVTDGEPETWVFGFFGQDDQGFSSFFAIFQKTWQKMEKSHVHLDF